MANGALEVCRRVGLDVGVQLAVLTERARHFGISRPPFYHWHRRHRERGLVGLEDRSHRPRVAKQRTWTGSRLPRCPGRERKPRVGRGEAADHPGSAWFGDEWVHGGRILTALKVRGESRELPPRVRRRGRSCARPWAVRGAKRQSVALWPGHLVKVDTKDIRFIDGRPSNTSPWWRRQPVRPRRTGN